jgi:hypothetical protein
MISRSQYCESVCRTGQRGRRALARTAPSMPGAILQSRLRRKSLILRDATPATVDGAPLSAISPRAPALLEA